MNWQQINWPLALLIYGGLLAAFGVGLFCSYLPMRSMKVPADRTSYFRWLLVIWSLTFLVGFVLPTLTLFGILPNWSITDPATTTPLLMAVVFMFYFPWIFRRMKASPFESNPDGSKETAGEDCLMRQ
jgi:hypothetical protein